MEMMRNEVAQIVNLLYRRLAIGGGRQVWRCVVGKTVGGVPVCDTADCQSALRILTQLHAHSRFTWLADPSRNQPSSWAWSLSCWPRKRGTTANRVFTSGRA